MGNLPGCLDVHREHLENFPLVVLDDHEDAFRTYKPALEPGNAPRLLGSQTLPQEVLSLTPGPVKRNNQDWGKKWGGQLLSAIGLRSGSLEALEFALSSAETLMQEYRVLDAEFVLAKALEQLRGDESAMQKLMQAPVFYQVALRVDGYDRAGRFLDVMQKASRLNGKTTEDGFDLVWEGVEAQLWVKASADATKFQTRLILTIDAPLHQCLASINELDLHKHWQPMLVQDPDVIGPRTRLHHVCRSIQSALLFRIELLVENTRIINRDYGLLVERVLSTFPTHGLEMPERSWMSTRVHSSTTNLWIPQGGGSKRTLMLSEGVVDAGFQVPDSLLYFVCQQAAPNITEQLRKHSILAGSDEAVLGWFGSTDNPWKERIRTDERGFYAELKEAEAAAAWRPEISLGNLPSRQCLARPNLPDELRAQLKEKFNEVLFGPGTADPGAR